MTIPHLVPEFPLLQQFVRITPRPGANVPHELYAFHRHGLLVSQFQVRKACSSDLEQACIAEFEFVDFSYNKIKRLKHYLMFQSFHFAKHFISPKYETVAAILYHKKSNQPLLYFLFLEVV